MTIRLSSNTFCDKKQYFLSITAINSTMKRNNYLYSVDRLTLMSVCQYKRFPIMQESSLLMQDRFFLFFWRERLLSAQRIVRFNEYHHEQKAIVFPQSGNKTVVPFFRVAVVSRLREFPLQPEDLARGNFAGVGLTNSRMTERDFKGLLLHFTHEWMNVSLILRRPAS